MSNITSCSSALSVTSPAATSSVHLLITVLHQSFSNDFKVF